MRKEMRHEIMERNRKLHVGVPGLDRTDTADPETRGCDVSSPTCLYKPVPLAQAAEWWQALA